MKLKVKRKSNVLILGGSGMLGYHCIKELNKKFQVFTTYNEKKISYKNSFKLRINTKDSEYIKTLKEILLNVKPNVIINTIGLVSVEGCEDNYELARKLNSDFISELNDLLKKLELKSCHLIQISSAGVYGNKSNNLKAWKETDTVNPISNYAKTKLFGEKSALENGLKTTIIRTDFYGLNPVSEKSLLWFIIKCVSLNMVIDGWQNILFSPISAKKLANVISKIISKEIFGIYNIGCMNSCNKYDFTSKVCKILGVNNKVKKIHLFQDRPIRPNYSVVNSLKLRKYVNLNFTWEEDLKSYMSDLPDFPDKRIFIK